MCRNVSFIWPESELNATWKFTGSLLVTGVFHELLVGQLSAVIIVVFVVYAHYYILGEWPEETESVFDVKVTF